MDLLEKLDLTVTFSPLKDFKGFFFQHYKGASSISLLETVIKSDIGPKYDLTPKQSCDAMKVAGQAFRNLEERHKNIVDYSRFFSKNCQSQTDPAQIRKSCQTILHKVISNELLGNTRNNKQILKTLYNLLKTAKYEPFTLLQLIQKINVSSIPWIKQIEGERTKYLLIAKFLKWLFYFFISLICHVFNVTYVKNKRVYIYKKDWIKQTKNYMKKMDKKLALVPVKNNKQTVKRLCLVPKKDGVRSIVKNKYTDEEKIKLRQALCILKHLYEENFNNLYKDFRSTYTAVIKQSAEYKISAVHMVSNDVTDAYGSIRQNMLFEIIIEMFADLPDILNLDWTDKNNSRTYQYLINPAMMNDCKNKNRIEHLSKCDILTTVEDFIFDIKVLFNKKTYVLCKGVAPGLTLSAILSDIYYAHMQKKYYEEFVKNGHVFHHVDDTLFLTDNKEIAKKYINRVAKGIPKYNCWTNRFKLQSNLDGFTGCSSQTDSNKIMFLGWKINSTTFEVEPKYSSARYSTSFIGLDYSNLEQRLRMFGSLKIEKLLLDRQINSKSQIFLNIKAVAAQQAKRAFALIDCLNKSKNVEKLFQTIKRVNLKLVRRILSLADELKVEERHVNYILWRAFLSVFSKRHQKYIVLIEKFKIMMRRNQKRIF